MMRMRFIEFVRQAFPNVFPTETFKYNWHIEAVAQEYEDLFDGQTQNLMVNQPPATTKTVLMAIFFPAWVWTMRPQTKFCMFVNALQCGKHITDCFERLVSSEWYKETFAIDHCYSLSWPYANRFGGFMMPCCVGSITCGVHPDYYLISDPNRACDSSSWKKTSRVIEWYSQEKGKRGTAYSKTVIESARLSTEDLCGSILGESESSYGKLPKGWRHICLPMMFDPSHPYRYDKDQRTEKGALLWPEHITLDDVMALKRMMDCDPLQLNVDAQFSQLPFIKIETKVDAREEPLDAKHAAAQQVVMEIDSMNCEQISVYIGIMEVFLDEVISVFVITPDICSAIARIVKSRVSKNNGIGSDPHYLSEQIQWLLKKALGDRLSEPKSDDAKYKKVLRVIAFNASVPNTERMQAISMLHSMFGVGDKKKNSN